MKRTAFLIALLAICIGAYFLIPRGEEDVALLDARAVPVAGQTGMFMVTLEVENNGDAKRLLSVSSASADHVHVMNPGYHDASIVIPAKSSGLFAMDGAHLMLMSPSVDFEEGSFIPLTLEFEEYGEVTTRLLHIGAEAGMAGMNHDMTGGIQVDPSPQIQLNATDGFDTDGSEIVVTVENFDFTLIDESAPHVANQGHAHVYLNGLKLGRIFEPSFSLGPVVEGSYDLKVALNSNNHSPYMTNGAAVAATLSFTLE